MVSVNRTKDFYDFAKTLCKEEERGLLVLL